MPKVERKENYERHGTIGKVREEMAGIDRGRVGPPLEAMNEALAATHRTTIRSTRPI